jgi:hypothetical protein
MVCSERIGASQPTLNPSGYLFYAVFFQADVVSMCEYLSVDPSNLP